MRFFFYHYIFLFGFFGYTQITDFKNINFKKADYIALNLKGHSLKNLPELSYLLTKDLNTDVEKFRAIFKWVCTNISNDYNLYLRNENKRFAFRKNNLKLRNWNTRFKKLIFKKLLKKKRTICTGYAYLIKELSNLALLECHIVQGFGRVSTTKLEHLITPNHSWNVVKLNNKWYLCDATWASGEPNPDTNAFTFKYNNDLFLSHPEVFGINHFAINHNWNLNSNKQNISEFIKNPIIYNSAYTYITNLHKPTSLKNKITIADAFEIKLKASKYISKKDIVLLIDNGNTSNKKNPDTIEIDQDNIVIKHRFTKKGFFDVHLFIKNEIIVSFSVEVNKPL